MFKTLTSRLLLSFFVVIAAVLLLIAGTLFITATMPQIRLLPALQRLATISQLNQVTLRRLQLARAPLADYQTALDETAVENNVRILIINSSGEVMYDTTQAQTWVGTTLQQGSPLQGFPNCSGRERDAFLFQYTDGSRWLMCAQMIALPDSRRARLAYIQPEPNRRQFFQEFYLTPLVRAGLVAFLLSILLAVWITSSVTQPLKKMAGAVEAIAQGDYDQQLPLQGPQEIQQVAASFNSMATQVNATQQAQRDFVANVSHDLKTPITSIQGWSQALLDGTAVTPEARERAATIISSESQRMARMVNQLLDLARIESGQFELSLAQVDLSQVLTAVHHNLRWRAEAKKIHLTLALEPVPPIWGDYDRLMQLFTNLVDNGLAYTEANGRVHITLQQHGEKAVEVVVQDTGSGIPPEQLSRIFERFYQADKARVRKESGAGSGLGLSIVRQLVEAHNGRIQVRSQPGKGSAFLVRLPISDQPADTTIIHKH